MRKPSFPERAIRVSGKAALGLSLLMAGSAVYDCVSAVGMSSDSAIETVHRAYDSATNSAIQFGVYLLSTIVPRESRD